MSNWITVKNKDLIIDKDDLTIYVSDDIKDLLYDDSENSYLDIPVKQVIELLKSIGYEVI